MDIYHAFFPLQKIICRVIDEEISVTQLLALVHEEHAMAGEITIIEQAHFVKICRDRLDEQAQHQLFHQLGIPDTPYTLDRLTALLELEISMQADLWQGNLAENMARELLRLKRENRQTFYDLVVTLGLGGGKQKRLLSLLKDLAGRNGVSFQAYLNQETIRAILEHTEMNVPQKGQVLLQLLQQLHSPALTGTEERFLSWKRQLDLPRNCSVEHSPSFEQDEVSLTVRFSDRRELEIFLGRIRQES